MPKGKAASSSESSRKMRPALSPEARENQLVSLAVDLAEKQLREGTASSQVITHYLKLGSTKEKIEKEILEKQKELIEAKTQNLQSAKRVEELYTNALNAMRHYSGVGGDEDECYVIIRDNGCDLGFVGHEIFGPVLIHHINPITYEDIVNRNPCVFDLENVICTQLKTHNAIHYGDESILILKPVQRSRNDTCPWRKN